MTKKTITDGPLKGRTFECAPQQRVARLDAYVQRVLDALGHPEAFVTDQSTLGDFYRAADPDSDAKLARVAERLGLMLSFDDYIADVAERLMGGQ